MNILARILLSALAVIVAAYVLPGVFVDDFLTAIVIAIILAVLNVTVKPLLVLLTIPLTIFTLGLFLIIINGIIILMASALIPGFQVDGLLWALLFSLVLSILNAILIDMGGKK